MNTAVDSLDMNNQNQKKGIPNYDVRNFDYTNTELITFNKANSKIEKIDEKFEEREDDTDFEDSPHAGKKPESFADRAVEEDDLLYLNDKRKLEVIKRIKIRRIGG